MADESMRFCEVTAESGPGPGGSQSGPTVESGPGPGASQHHTPHNLTWAHLSISAGYLGHSEARRLGWAHLGLCASGLSAGGPGSHDVDPRGPEDFVDERRRTWCEDHAWHLVLCLRQGEIHGQGDLGLRGHRERDSLHTGGFPLPDYCSTMSSPRLAKS